MHPANAADIARSVEHGTGGIIQKDTLGKIRALGEKDFPGDRCIWVELIEEEPVYELVKAWLLHVQKCVWRNWCIWYIWCVWHQNVNPPDHPERAEKLVKTLGKNFRIDQRPSTRFPDGYPGLSMGVGYRGSANDSVRR
ncbi:hypothetical protein B0H10DRAFT_1969719 [Mycena sp. CBHHK59/15]|nr:hypothetical protein B0H10DRAFT_1969719 [Mycena sp. CBHHK59/15]